LNRVSALVSSAAQLGIGRLLGVTPSHLISTTEEYLQGGTSAQQAAGLADFTDKPLAVLTAGTGSQPGWNTSQEALASLSTNTSHRIIQGATHASFITDQEHAAAAARGIIDVVSAVRNASPLMP
jgi:hypothetical protein